MPLFKKDSRIVTPKEEKDTSSPPVSSDENFEYAEMFVSDILQQSAENIDELLQFVARLNKAERLNSIGESGSSKESCASQKVERHLERFFKLRRAFAEVKEEVAVDKMPKENEMEHKGKSHKTFKSGLKKIFKFGKKEDETEQQMEVESGEADLTAACPSPDSVPVCSTDLGKTEDFDSAMTHVEPEEPVEGIKETADDVPTSPKDSSDQSPQEAELNEDTSSSDKPAATTMYKKIKEGVINIFKLTTKEDETEQQMEVESEEADLTAACPSPDSVPVCSTDLGKTEDFDSAMALNKSSQLEEQDQDGCPIKEEGFMTDLGFNIGEDGNDIVPENKDIPTGLTPMGPSQSEKHHEDGLGANEEDGRKYVGSASSPSGQDGPAEPHLEPEEPAEGIKETADDVPTSPKDSSDQSPQEAELTEDTSSSDKPAATTMYKKIKKGLKNIFKLTKKENETEQQMEVESEEADLTAACPSPDSVPVCSTDLGKTEDFNSAMTHVEPEEPAEEIEETADDVPTSPKDSSDQSPQEAELTEDTSSSDKPAATTMYTKIKEGVINIFKLTTKEDETEQQMEVESEEADLTAACPSPDSVPVCSTDLGKTEDFDSAMALNKSSQLEEQDQDGCPFKAEGFMTDLGFNIGEDGNDIIVPENRDIPTGLTPMGPSQSEKHHENGLGANEEDGRKYTESASSPSGQDGPAETHLEPEEPAEGIKETADDAPTSPKDSSDQSPQEAELTEDTSSSDKPAATTMYKKIKKGLKNIFKLTKKENETEQQMEVESEEADLTAACPSPDSVPVCSTDLGQTQDCDPTAFELNLQTDPASVPAASLTGLKKSLQEIIEEYFESLTEEEKSTINQSVSGMNMEVEFVEMIHEEFSTVTALTIDSVSETSNLFFNLS